MNQHTAKKTFTAMQASRLTWLGTSALLLTMASGCLAEQGPKDSEAAPAMPNPTNPQDPAVPQNPPGPNQPTGSAGIATSRRVAWQADMPNVEPGIWEYAVMFAEVDALPVPGITPTWQPRATIELRFHQVNFNTSSEKVATLIERQAATVTDVAADGFTLQTADGSSVWLGQEMAFLTQASPATMAAFEDQATWALTGFGWCSAIDGEGYENYDIARYALADLGSDLYAQMPVAAVETTYGLVKKIENDEIRLQCVLGSNASAATCQLMVSGKAMLSVTDDQVVFASNISGAEAAALRQALLGAGQADATFGSIQMHCAADACALTWQQARVEMN